MQMDKFMRLLVYMLFFYTLLKRMKRQNKFSMLTFISVFTWDLHDYAVCFYRRKTKRKKKKGLQNLFCIFLS